MPMKPAGSRNVGASRGHLDRVWPDVHPAPKSLGSRIQRVPARAGSGVQGESSRAIDRTPDRRRYSPGSGPVGVYIWVASAVPSVRKASRALPTWMTSLGLSGVPGSGGR
jgi:hypothetical protein